ncbi:MAG: Gfo/Idh/MocA family oxidoreductase [Burkholderiales bacterium]
MTKTLRVGIIGANARGGWAAESHVPAVQGLDGLELVAVATNKQETAEEAAHAFGVSRAYPNGLALITDPDIDVVTVATRVPDHRELVMAAIAAGKHVYSEWPLGPTSADADAMSRAADGAGIHHAIGLQLRGSPSVKAAIDLLRSRTIGRLLSISGFSSTAGFGPDVPSPFAYLEDPSNFANLVTIQGAHTLDLVMALGGTPARLSALTSRQFPTIRLGDDGAEHQRETFDHLLVQGQFGGGTPFAIEVAGGRKGETPFFLDVIGEEGKLRLEGGAPRGLQSGRIALLRNGEQVRMTDGEQSALPEGALNVAGVYAELRDDIRHDTRIVRGFDHAAGLTRMIEAVLRSSSEGRSIVAQGWPA